MHLGHIHKYQQQPRAINLNNPESQAMHLETRLVQLDSAIKMELWQVCSDRIGLFTVIYTALYPYHRSWLYVEMVYIYQSTVSFPIF